MSPNPTTGEKIKIAAKTVVKFRVSKSVKDLVLGGRYKILLKDGERRGEKVTEVVLEESGS